MDFNSYFNYPGKKIPEEGQHHFLDRYDENDWKKLLAYSEEFVVEPKGILIEEGTKHHSLCILKKGSLGVFLKKKNKRPIQVAYFSEGAVVGEMSFLDGGPAAATVMALSESFVIRLHWEKFQQFLAQEPYLAFVLLHDVATMVSKKLRTSNELLIKMGG